LHPAGASARDRQEVLVPQSTWRCESGVRWTKRFFGRVCRTTAPGISKRVGHWQPCFEIMKEHYFESRGHLGHFFSPSTKQEGSANYSANL